MGKLASDYRMLVTVDLPNPRQGRQHYMHTFDLARPSVPPGFEDYLKAVKALCKAAGATEGQAHLTIDEKVVKAGWFSRRHQRNDVHVASRTKRERRMEAKRFREEFQHENTAKRRKEGHAKVPSPIKLKA